jgi:NAD(P)-dependent dehydrogenase (short-subunit alcohol dehydrogenase family)
MDIAGQIAIITGGASGLGLATAEALAGKGATVVLLDRNAEAAQEQAKRLGGLGIGVDVADSDGVEAAVARVTAELGTARILINCAGIGVAQRVVGKEGAVKLGDFERVIRVNLLGTFNVLRVVAAEIGKLDALPSGERGVIVNAASVAAFDGQIGQAAYAASKAGVAGMTLPIAREFARMGIRVNTIAPGLFLTPLLAALPQEAQDSLAAAIPFPARLGQPSEFADLALHIVSNAYLNGETIRLDGSLRMAPK